MLFLLFLSELPEMQQDIVIRIYEDYKKYMYYQAYDILKNESDAEDAIETAMMNVMNHINRFTDVSEIDIQSQLHVYIENASINLYNKNKRKAKIEIDVEDASKVYEDDCLTYENYDFDPENIVIRSEDAEAVAKLILELSDPLKDAIVLVYGHGYSYAEAADILGISVNALGLRIMKAKKKIAKKVGVRVDENV